ncbi:hypothetical protein OG520_45030 (plasmid) [Streptomyces sp. NBC_00984]|uniref:hypothetical protein n=1 Tax=Streptomyces sp. NBC_00984 TaxID=2903700 RepID=UPI00386A3A38|nr:hypothetical protein OG520_45030 [Streptomyces sp. NBC_00984]
MRQALSQGAAKAGWDASTLDPAIRGMGILLADRYRRIRSLWLDGTDLLKVIDTRTRTGAERLRGQWTDPFEAAMRSLGCATPPPGRAVPPQPADPDEGLGEDPDDEFDPDTEDWEDDTDLPDGNEDDGVRRRRRRTHPAAARTQGGPRRRRPDPHRTARPGTRLRGLADARHRPQQPPAGGDVEPPAGGQLRVLGAWGGHRPAPVRRSHRCVPGPVQRGL